MKQIKLREESPEIALSIITIGIESDTMYFSVASHRYQITVLFLVLLYHSYLFFHGLSLSKLWQHWVLGILLPLIIILFPKCRFQQPALVVFEGPAHVFDGHTLCNPSLSKNMSRVRH